MTGNAVSPFRASLLVATILVARICTCQADAEVKPRAVIVAPFDASSLVPSDQWMGEGVAQLISLGLAQQPALIQIERCKLGTASHPTDLTLWTEPLVRQAATDVQAEVALHGRIGRKGAELVLEPQLLDLKSGQTIPLQPMTFPDVDLLTRVAALPAAYARVQQVPLSDAEKARMERAARPTQSLRALELFTRGQMAFYAGANDGAVDLLLRAIQADGSFAMAQYVLGIVHLVLKNRWKAQAQLRVAIMLDSTMPEPYKALGDLYLGQPLARFDIPIEFYSKAIGLRPFYADGHIGLGDAKAAKGDVDGAIVAYQAALTFDPFSPRAHIQLGRIYADRGRYTDSVSAYKQAIELNCRWCWQRARPNSPLCDQFPFFRL